MEQTQSMDIGELAGALAVAQGEITGALKDSENPFFKSKYADLASVWDACRGPLSKNGLAVVQTTISHPDGICVLTTLVHKSGQWIRGELVVKPKDASPQGIGSCLTYMRRYALAAIVGVAQVDDDGNAASGKTWGDNSGRPETAHVDPIVASEYARAMADIIAANDPKRAKALHDELNADQAMYTAAADSCGSKAKWKALVAEARKAA
jgi:hypothetical protein